MINIANESLYIDLGIKDNGSKKTINELQKELKNLDKVYANTKKATENFEDSQEGVSKKLEYLNKKYEVTKAKLEQYKKAMENARQSIEKKKAQLEELENSEEQNTTAINKLKSAIDKAEKSFNDNRRQVELTESELQVLEKEIKQTSKSLENLKADEASKNLKELGSEADNTKRKLGDIVSSKIKSDLKTLSSECEKVSDKMSKIGDGVSNAGEKITKLSAGAIGGMTALAINSNNITSSLDMMNVKLDLSSEEIERLKKVALGIYKEGFGESVDDSVNALIVLTQQIEEVANANDDTKKEIVEQMLTISQAYGLSTEEITNALRSLTTNGVVKDVQEGLDIITRGFQEGGDAGGELIDTLREYAPQFKKLGLSADEAMKYIVEGAKNGGWSIDKLADAMKEFSVRSLEGADGTKQAFKDIGLNADEMVSKMNKGGDSAKEVWKSTLQALANCTDEQKRNNAMLSLMGTQYEDLGADALLSLNNVSGGMENLEGSSKKAQKALEETTGQQFKSNLRDIQTELIPLGVEFTNIAKKYMPDFVDAIKKIINALDKIPFKEGVAQASIYGLAIGTATKTLGGFVKGGSEVVSAVGKISKHFSKTKEVTEGVAKATDVATSSFKLLNPVTIAVGAGLGAVAVGVKSYEAYQKNANKTVLDSAESYSFLESMVASFTGQLPKTQEELEKTGIKHKDFAKGISKEFKSAVNSARDDIGNFNLELAKITFDNTITEEESANLNSRLDTAINNCINTINSHYEEGQNSLINLFTLNDGQIDSNEQQIIDSVMRQKEVYTNETNTLKSEIQDLVKRINESNNEEEIAQMTELIRQKYARLKQIELECQAQTDEEKLLAKEDFESQIASMDLETASKKLKEIKKNSDEQIELAKESYDQQRAILLEGYDSLSAEEKAKRDEGLARAKENYESKLSSENEYWQECLGIVQSNNKAIYDNIDMYDGSIMTEKDLKRKAELEAYTSHYDGLNQITETGYYKLKDKVTGEEQAIYAVVDETSGNITGVYNYTTGEVLGYNEKMKNSADSLGHNFGQNSLSIKQSLALMSNSTVDSKGRIVGANGEIVNSLKNVKENADGTREGIINLNGQSINVKVNKDGTISNLKQIRKEAEEASKPRTLTITIKKIGEAIVNGITGGTKRASGMAYVPYNGMPAILHTGERILTAQENREYNRSYFSPNTSQGKALSKIINNTYNNTTINNNGSNGISANDLLMILNTMQSNIVSALSSVNITLNSNIDKNGLVSEIKRNITREQRNRRV